MSEKWRQWIECPVCRYRFDTTSERRFDRMMRVYRCLRCDADLSKYAMKDFNHGWCPPGMVLVMDEKSE